MSALPAWIEKLKIEHNENQMPGDVPPNCSRIFEALEIAWEALDRIRSATVDYLDADRDARVLHRAISVAQTTKSRIAALGKE